MELSFVEIKAATEVENLANLATEIWREHFTPIIGSAQVTYMLDKFQSFEAINEQLKQGYHYYFFKLNSLNIGYMGIHPETEALFLSKLYIKKEYRGNGYSRQAIDFLQDFCKQNKLTEIVLTVNRHNLSTIAVYEKLGFQKIREQKSAIGNGFFMDDYIMKKTII